MAKKRQHSKEMCHGLTSAQYEKLLDGVTKAVMCLTPEQWAKHKGKQWDFSGMHHAIYTDDSYLWQGTMVIATVRVVCVSNPLHDGYRAKLGQEKGVDDHESPTP